jgi:hypothetical protein
MRQKDKMAEINPVVGNCYLCGEPIRRLEFYAGSTKTVRHIDCPKETKSRVGAHGGQQDDNRQ